MTEQEQIIALAEWDGWHKDGALGSLQRWKRGTETYVGSFTELLTSIDAIMPIERKLDDKQHKLFREKLCVICIGDKGPISATAAQRAEAILKTLNLWRTET